MAEKILLVDDEVEFVEALAERLRARGLEVDAAHDGPTAIAKAREEVYDAVVLDFAMPGMNGTETLETLRAENGQIQVMLLTGRATIKVAVEATRLGAVDVLEKPTDVETLTEKIREARARRVAAAKRATEAQIEQLPKTRGR